METFHCDICGQDKPVPKGPGGTGYGRDREGRTVCYACCADQDAQEMRTTGQHGCLYFTDSLPGEPAHVSNWPGSLTLPVYYQRTGRHNIAGKQIRVYFEFEGQPWTGVQFGTNTELLRGVRRIKGGR